MIRLSASMIGVALAGSLLAAVPTHAATEMVLHAFQGGTDGAYPTASLLNVSGTLYGTTFFGGGAGCFVFGGNGCGTVFSMTTAGTETIVYSFQGGSDGALPAGHLRYNRGQLYGTTEYGGGLGSCGSGCGAVFSITPAGSETTLHAFSGANGDGSTPLGGVTFVAGKLFGTTSLGSGGDGIVFGLTRAGYYKVLQSFGGENGASPQDLINVDGTLYGTAQSGGPNNCGQQDSCGTVFSVTPGGNLQLLYAFQGGTDGANPLGSLINVGGTLYGTTFLGGAFGDGTVFSVTPAGVEKVLYSFQGGTDGANPNGSLINVGGTLYGTSSAGGSGCGFGCGAVFSVTTGGVETVLYSFQGGSDGADPAAGLTNVHGTLYGTTKFGGGTGCNGSGCGTVFSVTR